MSQHEREVSPPNFDAGEFWHEHDRALPLHQNLGNVTLSHDLYRGMPPWFNYYYAYFQRQSILRLLRRCSKESEGRILDLGCGTGRWSQLMLLLGWQPYGIDVGRQALSYAAKNLPGAYFTCGMLPSLCFADESFNLAISVTVMQHVPHEHQQDSINAVYHVLKSGGYLLLCETIDTSDFSPHIYGNSLEKWMEIFTKAGFQLVSVIGSEYIPHVRVFHWLRNKRKPSSSTKYLDVGEISQLLTKRKALSLLVRLALTISYPFEYIASVFLPVQWARIGCFLLQKV